MYGRHRSTASLLLATILLLGAALRFTSLTFGLPNPEIRPDETVLVGIALGLTYAGLNPHFFHWPSLEFYALAAVYRVWYIYGHSRGWYHIKYDMFRAAAANATYWVLVPRVFAAVAGVATVWLVYRVMRHVFDRNTGVIAAFFMSVAFLNVRDSHFGVTDVPATLFVVAAMLPLSRLLANPTTRRDWVAAGVFSGLAASTKYAGGMVALAGAALALWVLVTKRDDAVQRRAVLTGLAVMTLVAVLAFVAGTPYSVIDARHFLEGLQFDNEHLMTGHGMKLERGWSYHMWFSLWYGLGAPLLIAGVVGMFLLAIRSPRKALLLWTFPVAYYLLVGRGYTVFARYVDPLVPFLCMGAAITVVEAVRKTNMKSPRSAGICAAVIALAVGFQSLQRDVAFNRLVRRPDTRLIALEWLEAHRQPGDWIMESSPALLHSVFVSPPPMMLRFDEGESAFYTQGGVRVQADWIVLPRTALGIYMKEPAALHVRVRRGDYALAARFIAAGDESPLIFDQQDMFLVPLGDFRARERSGPDIYIYRRVAIAADSGRAAAADSGR